jgi:rhodanese-related sulfurtransferase
LIVYFVTKRLAFGSKVRLNRHVDKLRGLGITHVIDVRLYPSKKLRKFKTIHLNFKDNARARPMWFYARALCFYRIALERQNSKIFVMCRGGRRRSAWLTYFLLRASGKSPYSAETVVQGARPCAKIVKAYSESGEKHLRREGIGRSLRAKNSGP